MTRFTLRASLLTALLLVCLAIPSYAATLTVAKLTSAGATQTLAAVAAGGDSFANDGHTFITVKNAHASNTYTVTFTTTRTVEGIAVADVAVALAVTSTKVIGPFPIGVFGRTVSIAYTGTAPATDLTVQAASIAP